LGGGGGRGRWSSGRPVSVCDGVGPPRFPHWPGVQTRTWSPQSIAAVRREGMTIGSHPSPIAPEVDIKTFPSPHYQKNQQLYRGTCFWKFPKLLRTKVQNVRTGVRDFSPSSGKGVNIRIDNLRVHTIGSDTRTTSVGTTALSHNIVFICGDINALGWDPRVLFWENFRLWRPNRAFEVAGVAFKERQANTTGSILFSKLENSG
jgi:hypothetical protein